MLSLVFSDFVALLDFNEPVLQGMQPVFEGFIVLLVFGALVLVGFRFYFLDY